MKKKQTKQKRESLEKKIMELEMRIYILEQCADYNPLVVPHYPQYPYLPSPNTYPAHPNGYPNVIY